MSSIRQGADSADRPEIHVEQDDALARLGLFSSCPPASAFQKVDFGNIVLGADFFSTNLSKLIDSSKIWAESTGLVTAYYDSVMSKIPIDGLAQAVSSFYDHSSRTTTQKDSGAHAESQQKSGAGMAGCCLME